MHGTETLLLSRSLAIAALIAGSLLLNDGLFEAVVRSFRKNRDRIRKRLLQRSPVPSKTTSSFCEIDMSKMN